MSGRAAPIGQTAARVATLRAAGRSPGQIAVELGLHPATIKWHLKRLHLVRPYGKDNRESVQRCHAAGMSRRAIAAHLRIHPTTVDYHLNGLAFAKRGRGKWRVSVKDPAPVYRRCDVCGGRELVSEPHRHGEVA